MKCPVCNSENVEGSVFCSKCGGRVKPPVNAQEILSTPVVEPKVQEQPVEPVKPVEPAMPVQPVAHVQPVQPVVQPSVQPQVVNTPKPFPTNYQPPVLATPTPAGGLDNKQKGIILGLLGIVVVLLIVAVFTTVNNNKKVAKGSNKEDTRTIMIYLDGADLESKHGIASAELDAIDPSTLDLNKTNIIVYTGGSTKWFNFVKNDENAIYKLTNDGYVKIETYDKLDMGDPNTLASFLEYCYKNYKAGHMDLVLFDHGGAIDGAIYDSFTDNHITLENFQTALKKSPFNKDNKLELIAFRTCLNGTLENALVFANYAEYLVASEDITYGTNTSNVFGYFINGMPSNEDGIEVGKRFINAYNKNIDNICYFPDQLLITYAIIDLSKIEELGNEFDKFINGINVSSNYASLARLRSGMLQFAMTSSNDVKDYDTVDMYDLVEKTSSMSNVDSKAFKDAFNKSVVYYYTNDKENTHGLSIYFPYSASKNARSYFLNIYNKFSFLGNYRKFISNFNDLRNGESPKAFSFSNSKIETSSDKEVSLTLSDEQKDNYLGARYAVLMRDKEKPNFYEFIFISDDVDESEQGIVKTKIGNNLIKVYDGNENMYVALNRTKTGDKITDYVGALIYDKSVGEYGKLNNVNILVSNNGTRPVFGDAIITHSRDERYAGVVKDLNQTTSIQLFKTRYKILDKNGHIKPTEDWETSSTMYGLEFKDFTSNDVNDEIDLRYTGLDDDNEYYILFILYDMNGNSHLNDLIKVGA